MEEMRSEEVAILPSSRRRTVSIMIIIVALVGFTGLLVYQRAVSVDKDRFYLSVWLYADKTHECYYHNPATCDAQFKSVPVKYRLESLDGQILIENKMNTTSKGWLDFYLPIDMKYRVEFEVEGMRGSGVISTDAKAPTCISTIKVS